MRHETPSLYIRALAASIARQSALPNGGEVITMAASKHHLSYALICASPLASGRRTGKLPQSSVMELCDEWQGKRDDIDTVAAELGRSGEGRSGRRRGNCRFRAQPRPPRRRVVFRICAQARAVPAL